jgi:hypothetical protein
MTNSAGIHALSGAMRAPWAVLFLMSVACTSSSSNSGDAGGSGPTCGVFDSSGFVDASTTCTMKYAECTDGLTYTVSCSGPPAPCSCEVDGGAAGQFDTNVCGLAYAPQLAAVNQGCGWSIR